jgi:Tfp pilus assembly protein PilN
MKSIIFLLLITGCMLPPSGSEILVKLSPTKQKQKIAFLQKKLQLAEKDQKKIAEVVDFLHEEIKKAELAFVRRIVSETEEKLRKFEENPLYRSKFTENEISNLFLEEREILHRIIQAPLTPASLEAQGLLDQILRLITSLSDEPFQPERIIR